MISPDDAVARDGEPDDLQLSTANHAVIVSIGRELFETGEQQPLYRLGILRAAALVMVDAAMAGPDPWTDLPDMVEDLQNDAFSILKASLGELPAIPAPDAAAGAVGITVNQGTILLVAEIHRAVTGAAEWDFAAVNQAIKTAISNLRATKDGANPEAIQ